jgi:hypothetical protein
VKRSITATHEAQAKFDTRTRKKNTEDQVTTIQAQTFIRLPS